MVQWFPGHMSKTRKIIKENLKNIDIAILMLDARIPKSSYNPLLEELLGDKPSIILLNKADLADKYTNALWERYYSNKGFKTMCINAKGKFNPDRIFNIARELMRNKRERLIKKGYVNVPIRLMILGIPNVGKSTLINAMVGSNKAKVGNKPGVTKDKQWLKLKDEFELLDTPGILWPKFDSEITGYMLAFVGSISDDVINFEETALKFLDIMAEKFPMVLTEKYGLEYISDGYKNLLGIGKKRGCLIKGGDIDTEKTSRMIISDFRSGKLGNLTLEYPEGVDNE